MTDISINNLITIEENITGINSVKFNYLGKKIVSANRIDKIVGVFTSDIIVTTSSFLRWDSIEWTGNTTNKNISIFVRNGTSVDSILSSSWSGPYFDKFFNIDTFSGQYIQFIIVLIADQTTNPIINTLKLNFISSQDSVRFFSKYFSLGFAPKNIMLTYNATENLDSIIRFAITSQDTIVENKYQFISPNKIEELVNLSPNASGIKFMIEISGNSGLPVEIHEVSLAVGADQVSRINFPVIESSSSSSFSSSSESS